jgi:O-methyltransferase/methyltransferase family protein
MSDPSSQLFALINGFQVSQAISIMTTLGIPDILRGGSQDYVNLAEITRTHPRSLYRLLRALAAIGILNEDENGRFSLTPLGQPLRSDVASSQSAWACLLGRPMYHRAWSGLIDGIRTGEIAFDKAHGMSVWDFRAQHPDETAAFDSAMGAIASQIADAVLAAYDFSQYGTIADVGGGQGSFITKILQTYPTARGILFDQAHVVVHADNRLIDAGVADRCEVVGGDFFQSVPKNADLYILKWILHDWNDDDAIAILKSCRRAIGNSGKVIVVEYLIGDRNIGLEGKLMDLNMMVVTGGVERTREEYAIIFQAAGFRLAAVVPTKSPIVVIEACPSV